jgi:hypothetical protein
MSEATSGIHRAARPAVGPGSAERREVRCTASGTRMECTQCGDLPVGHFCVQSPLQKYFASPVGQIISTNSRCPTPQRGVSRSSRTRDGMRWTRQRLARDGVAGRIERSVSDQRASGREMLLRTAKSCGPDAPTLVSSLRSCVGPTGLRQNISADDGGKRARSPRRARHKP